MRKDSIISGDVPGPLAPRPDDPARRLNGRGPGAARTVLAVLHFLVAAVLFVNLSFLSLAMAPFAILIGRDLLRTERFATALGEGLAALRDTELVRGRRRFARLLASPSPESRYVGMLGSAVAALYEGDYARSLALGSEVFRASQEDERPRAVALLCMAYALGGQPDAAEAWLSEFDGTPISASHLEALVAARAGRYDEVLELPVEAGDTAPIELLHESTLLFLLRGFAGHRLGHSEEQVADELRSVVTRRPDELRYLARHWPELEEFLDTHPLAVRAPAPDGDGDSDSDFPKARVVSS